jgi:hypothetical protein
MTMTFSTAHILLTAAITAVLVFGVGVWRLPRGQWREALVVALLAGASVFVWRLSANKPQLNEDGMLGKFSANDWAAPVLTYVVLAGYGDLRRPADAARYRQLRALAAVVSLAVNVLTI